MKNKLHDNTVVLDAWVGLFVDAITQPWMLPFLCVTAYAD